MNDKTQLSLFDEPHITPPMNDELSLITLASFQGVGFATVKALFNAYGSHLTAVWDAHAAELLDVLHRAHIPQPEHVVRQIRSVSKTQITHAQERLHFLKVRRSVSIVFRDTDDYPPNLYSLKDAPAWLFVEGSVRVLQDTSVVAVVGTRTPTEQGLLSAQRTSLVLARLGYIILSGLADGIDAVAHQTSVDFGVPTIAVLGHGIDVFYPATTSGLRQRIVECGGAVISEYLPSDTYSKERFVSRNRIQAALSDAICVIEGQSKSGTAHTVRFGRQIGRKIFATRVIDLSVSEPQHSLLLEIEKAGNRVFDLLTSADQIEMETFLADVIPDRMRTEMAARARLFSGLLPEIHRLVHTYNGRAEDLRWLIEQIRAMLPSKG